MAGGGVAVKVDAAGVLEDAVEFHHALCHHGEVGHHIAGSQKGTHGLEEVGSLPGALVTTS